MENLTHHKRGSQSEIPVVIIIFFSPFCHLIFIWFVRNPSHGRKYSSLSGKRWIPESFRGGSGVLQENSPCRLWNSLKNEHATKRWLKTQQKKLFLSKDVVPETRKERPLTQRGSANVAQGEVKAEITGAVENERGRREPSVFSANRM